MKTILQVIFIAAASAMIGCEDDDDTEQPTKNPDTIFALNAASANLAEIDLGVLAREHGDNAAIREYGTLMETEHRSSLSDLQAIADQKNIELPTTLDSAHSALKQHLMMLHGMEFDTTYINAMIADHEKVIAEFETEANNGDDPEFKAYAANTLPHLNDHLTKAQQAKAVVMGQVTAGRQPD